MRALFNLAHRPQTREALVAAVWGSDSRIQARTIDVHVRRMRRALARIGCSEMLQTVRGIGYRFDPD
jgi:two-component system phosphate regulon response regulator PhoB